MRIRDRKSVVHIVSSAFHDYMLLFSYQIEKWSCHSPKNTMTTPLFSAILYFVTAVVHTMYVTISCFVPCFIQIPVAQRLVSNNSGERHLSSLSLILSLHFYRQHCASYVGIETAFVLTFSVISSLALFLDYPRTALQTRLK